MYVRNAMRAVPGCVGADMQHMSCALARAPRAGMGRRDVRPWAGAENRREVSPVSCIRLYGLLRVGASAAQTSGRKQNKSLDFLRTCLSLYLIQVTAVSHMLHALHHGTARTARALA